MNKFFYLTQTNSTNSFCLDNIKVLDHRSIVWATHQSSGRGQRSNRWQSTKDKSLCFSVVLKDERLKAYDVAQVIGLASQSIIEVFSPLVKNLRIKKPNDIYVDDKKLAGLLCETHLVNDKVEALVLGVGININQDKDDIDSWKLPYSATSLLLACDNDNKDFVIKEVLISLIHSFEKKF